MASLACCHDQIAVISVDFIKLCKLGTNEYKLIKNKKVKKTEEEEEKSHRTDESTERILAAVFSKSGKYLAVCDDAKQLTVWELSGQTLQKLSSRLLFRRGTSLTFTRSEDCVLVADKSGDVYSFSVSQCEEEGQLLLGHVSMLLDVRLCAEDKYLVTCDRDEKIRVSLYPRAHNIHSFCLGHEDFVTRLCYIEKQDLLLSGSGDGTVRLWNYQEGTQLACVQCSDNISANQKTDNTSTYQKDGDSDSTTNQNSDNASANQGEGDSDVTTNQGEGDPGEHKLLKCRVPSRVAVKSLVYCAKHSVVFVGFDQSCEVLVYHVKCSEASPSLVLQQTVSLSAPVWDLTVDDQGQLWVLQATEGATLQLYHWREGYTETAQLTQVTREDSSQHLNLIDEINKDWDFFKASLDVESMFSYLHKMKVDNAKDYLARKQLKQQKQQKQSDPVAPSSEVSSTTTEEGPETKKVKVDAL